MPRQRACGAHHFGVAMALLGLLLTAPSALAQQPVAFIRIDASALRMPLPGFAVIRDSAAWITLWQRWSQLGWLPTDGSWVHAAAPQIDFRREMAIAIARGESSGCANVQKYIARVVEWRDSIVVIPTIPPGPEVTCMMMIDPVDVVRVPRSDTRVVLQAEERWRTRAPPATWWWQPSAQEFESADPATQAVFELPLTRDSGTSRATIEAIARYSVVHPLVAQDLLLQRPEIRSNLRILTMLAGAHDAYGDSAVADILRRFGAIAVSDPAMPRDVLVRAVRLLAPRSAQGHEVAANLLRNPTFVTDSGLLVNLLSRVRDPDLRVEACRDYLARWTAWNRAFNPDGSFIGWNAVVSCPSMPPHPLR